MVLDLEPIWDSINPKIREFRLFGTQNSERHFVAFGCIGKVDKPSQVAKILSLNYHCHLAADNESVIMPLNIQLEKLLKYHGIKTLERIGRYEDIF